MTVFKIFTIENLENSRKFMSALHIFSGNKAKNLFLSCKSLVLEILEASISEENFLYNRCDFMILQRSLRRHVDSHLRNEH